MLVLVKQCSSKKQKRGTVTLRAADCGTANAGGFRAAIALQRTRQERQIYRAASDLVVSSRLDSVVLTVNQYHIVY